MNLTISQAKAYSSRCRMLGERVTVAPGKSYVKRNLAEMHGLPR